MGSNFVRDRFTRSMRGREESLKGTFFISYAGVSLYALKNPFINRLQFSLLIPLAVVQIFLQVGKVLLIYYLHSNPIVSFDINKYGRFVFILRLADRKFLWI